MVSEQNDNIKPLAEKNNMKFVIVWRRILLP